MYSLSKSQVTRVVCIPVCCMPYACACWYSSVICLSTLSESLRISKVIGFDNLYNVVAPLCYIHHLQVQSVPTNKGA